MIIETVLYLVPTGLKSWGSTFSINIVSLPNQRRMRVWHLAGLKRVSHTRKVLLNDT